MTVPKPRSIAEAVTIARSRGPVDPPTCPGCDALLPAWDAKCPRCESGKH